jgi:hypothetical protein
MKKVIKRKKLLRKHTTSALNLQKIKKLHES